ncbi:MAE_28990/MAE_18760 family HEPN-like nuclease [Pseudoalteromonas sp. T1lg23B]|uniref:MAE_28990/MAE_18760 family HEPN-like nuclease n=1 Tax=Pseudoalteromonas sp. T1lg23B TaxID=2077097 RepID=UPI000CF71EA7|nr:MAE_28990/MAE_18760 family HEPN-like nuclease [Pseudoalteromonas sp. T1lg23B]
MHKVIEEIVESNSWRDGEFAKLKVNSHEISSELWNRMCVPMIYAHWEGYIVSSLKIMIEFLNTLNLKPDDVPTKLVVIGLGDSYKSLSGKQNFQQRIEFTDKFSSLFGKAIKFKKKIDTKSNLRAEVLEELCIMFDFDFNKFKDCSSSIDRLVNVRNSIAHGENSFVITKENIQNFIEQVNIAMDIFLNEINEFLNEERYLLPKVA